MEPHIKTPALAERLGLSASTLTKWRLYGKGPAFKKFGSAVFYPESEVERWLAAQPVRRSTSDTTPEKTA